MTIIMKVCGIVGSPKKLGNVDLLVSQVLKGAKDQKARTDKIHLDDLRIKPCQSCGVDPNPKFCLFDDGMETIYTALQSCDVIVLGSPIFFDTVSAQVKLVIDRCNCLMPYTKRSDGTFGFEKRMEKRKKGICIAVAGTKQKLGPVQATVKGFFNWTNIELAETITFLHGDNKLGSVKNDEAKMNQAFQAGAWVVSSLKEGNSDQRLGGPGAI